MAILEGVWGDWPNPSAPRPTRQDSDQNPDRIVVTATPDEWTRIGDVQQTGNPNAPDTTTAFIPPERELVHRIARKVEVDVLDDDLVDWMKGA